MATASQKLKRWIDRWLRAARQDALHARQAFADLMEAARRSLTHINTFLAAASTNAARVLGLLVVLWLSVVLCISLFDRSTEIGEISVPKNLSDRGYTPDVAARRLRDTMAELSDKARNRYVVPETQKMRGAAIALNSEAVNIVVPTVGVSLNTVTTSLRNLLGLNWHRTISGEFSIRNDKLWLRLRMDGVSFYASKAGASVENPDDLLEDASHAIFAQIHPYFAAATEKDPQAAIKIAQQAIAHLPKTDETVVWCYILLGDLYGQVSDFSNARTALGTAGQLADKDADVHFFAGLIFGKQRNNDDAITEYNKTLDLNSHLAGAFNNRGYAYSIKNDTDRAIADYGEAIKIDPKFALALVNRGNIYYYTKKDFDKAFRDYNEAVEAAPTNPSALNGRGNVYYEKEDYVRALADYDVAIKLDPKLAAAFNGRGNVYLARKDYDNALANYNEAIRLDPTDTMAATKRASIAAFKKVDNHAPTDFSAAIKSDRDSASVYVNRASIYETSTTTTLYERSTTTTPRSTSAPSL